MLELGVAIAVRTHLLIEGLMNKLHCGMPAPEQAHHFGHEPFKLSLAGILHL